MARTRDTSLIIWPEYFDIHLTREEGRRVPKHLAIENPNSEELFQIAKKLGLSPVLETSKSHPSRWFRSSGRIRVQIDKPKTQVLMMIGRSMSKKRK
ncbi:MAG: signal recognition particle subunit SRP19/SEC65 family protein [Thermoplasmatota archaeon]